MRLWYEAIQLFSAPLQQMCNILVSCNLFVHLVKILECTHISAMKCIRLLASVSHWSGWIEWRLTLAWRTSKPSLPPCQDSARQCRTTKGGTAEDPLERKVAFRWAQDTCARASCWNPSTLIIVKGKKKTSMTKWCYVELTMMFSWLTCQCIQECFN